MKPIKIKTLGRIIFIILTLVILFLIYIFCAPLIKKKPQENEINTHTNEEKIVDYTESRKKELNFENYNDEEPLILIKESMTYVLSGDNQKYKIVVDAKSSVVKFVFSNYSTNLLENFEIKNAKKVIFELETGTINKVSSEVEENKYYITSNSDIEFVGKGTLKVELLSNFIKTSGNLSFTDSTIELNETATAIKTTKNITINSGLIYIKSNTGINCGGNFTLESGKLIVRSKNEAFKADGIFLINGGDLFLAGLSEIQKPNANSTQKTLILNFGDEMSKYLVLHNKVKRVLAYEGVVPYKHILYSTKFEDSSYILYYGGKISGTKEYGFYDSDDYAEDNQLTSETDSFDVADLINIYDNIVKK